MIGLHLRKLGVEIVEHNLKREELPVVHQHGLHFF